MLYGNDGKENEATTRANFFGEENVGDGGGDGSDGGVGAPSRRPAEKGEKKEEVVNVEKPRRNPKRRCIDSNRRLSYSTAADLRGTYLQPSRRTQILSSDSTSTLHSRRSVRT